MGLAGWIIDDSYIYRYQVQSIAVLSSIFITVVLALERYLAITKPIEYHNAIQGSNPWRRVWNYVIPVVAFSAIFNIPKFFEAQVVVREVGFDERWESNFICTLLLAEILWALVLVADNDSVVLLSDM